MMYIYCVWDAGVGQIDSNKTRRRRRVSPSKYGRLRPCMSVLTLGTDSGWPGEVICTSWAPLAAGNATSGEARGGGCKNCSLAPGLLEVVKLWYWTFQNFNSVPPQVFETCNSNPEVSKLCSLNPEVLKLLKTVYLIYFNFENHLFIFKNSF